MALRPLTPKQQRFVDEYLIDLNATAAALRAGYKDPNIGRQLITKNNVAAAIAAGQKKRSDKVEITQDWVLAGLLAEAKDHGEGSSHGARIKAFELCGRHIGMWPKQVEVNHTGQVAVKLTLEQALAADRELQEWEASQEAKRARSTS